VVDDRRLLAAELPEAEDGVEQIERFPVHG
jgi:hypothetical protein